jgi:hypothetical protein
LEQPCHHHVVEVIEASKDKRIYTAACNTSLDNLPLNTPRVMTTVNEIEIDDWMKIMQGCEDSYHNLPIHQNIILPLALKDTTESTDETTNTVTPVTDDNTLGSIQINGQYQSAQTLAPRRLTKASFNNKSYLDGYDKDGTIHITTGSNHDANHPSLIDPNPLMHLLGTALIHYANPKACAMAFAQP